MRLIHQNEGRYAREFLRNRRELLALRRARPSARIRPTPPSGPADDSAGHTVIPVPARPVFREITPEPVSIGFRPVPVRRRRYYRRAEGICIAGHRSARPQQSGG